ncbi:MAG: hypothetical protein AB7Q81_00730 [Gammaproteobacteria bacterium]
MTENAIRTAGLTVAMIVALAVTVAAHAYDPMPDPRMGGGPAAPGPQAGAGTIYQSGSFRDKVDRSGDSLTSRSSKRGEPRFGNGRDHAKGDAGYGGGYNRGGR